MQQINRLQSTINKSPSCTQFKNTTFSKDDNNMNNSNNILNNNNNNKELGKHHNHHIQDFRVEDIISNRDDILKRLNNYKT